MEINEKTIRKLLPEYRKSEINRIDKGSENWVFEIDRQYILKIPRHHTYEEKLKREIQFLEIMNGELAKFLPKFRKRIQIGIVIYEYDRLLGNPSDEVIEIRGKEISVQLGNVLSTLHNLEHKTKFKEALLVSQVDPNILCQESQNNREDVLKKINLEGRKKLHAHYEIDWKSIFSRNESELRLCHNDIKGEHIFLNENQSKMIGIIDWSDIKITEVYRDFAGIRIWQGERLLKDVLKSYSENGVDKEKEYESSKYYAIHRSIINLGKTIRNEWNAPAGLIKKHFHNSTGIKYCG